MSLILNVTDRILRPFGFQLYPILRADRKSGDERSTLAPVRLNMEASLAHLRSLGYTPSLIVDVGAAVGTHPLLNTWPKAPSLWVEPLKEFEPRLMSLSKVHPGRVLIAAASSEKGTLTMNVHNDLYGSSLLQESDGQRAAGVPR